MSKKQKSIQLKPKYKKIIISFLGIMGLAIIAFTIYLGLFYNRILVNTYLGNISLGGKSDETPKSYIESAVNNLPENLHVVIQNKEYPIKYSSVSFNIPVEKNYQKVFYQGRSNNVKQNIKIQLKSLFLKTKINWELEYDAKALTGEVNTLVNSIENQVSYPTISVEHGKFIVIDGKSGLFIDRQKLIAQIHSSWINGDFEKVIYEPTNMDIAEINQEYAKLAVQLNDYNQPIIINAEVKTKKIDTEVLKKWLTIVRDAENDNKISWEFDINNISNQLQEIAEEIKTSSQNAKLAFVNNEVIVTQDSIDGKKMDVDKGVSLILEGIRSKSKQVDVPVVKIPAEVTRQNYNTLGIKEIVGVASTNFKGSTANRRHNVANGASILNGTVVKPGAEFSTAAVMGDVSDTTGFLPELVIKGDRTIPEFGGGLCQVSTTLFRSVLNAGLKVTERRNHSYRVAYYEPPLGLDATVYFPHPDFRFVNDTDNHILVQSKIVGTTITFELYGTKDGRVSTIIGPDLISTTPAGEPKNIPSDTLFIGETKQIEKPHDGAVTIASYIVTKDGKELFKQTFKSVYKPWPAQFLVGTKEPPAPTPEVVPVPEAGSTPTV